MSSLSPKLTPPRRRSDTIRRDRLHRQLSDALENDVIIVSAPAGYGKSTLVVDWLSEAGLPTAWISLDRRDRDPRSLLRNLVAAVESATGATYPELIARLADDQRLDLDALASDFVDSIQLKTSDLFLLVIDDVNALAEGEASLALIDRIAQFIPLSMRLLLMTRSWAVLPSLPRLTAQRRAFTLTVLDLQFTDEESRAFLSKLGVDDEGVQRDLLTRADGWAAALAILAEHHDPSRRSDTGSAAEFVLADFLEHEVLSRLSADETSLLEACAILQTFDVSLIRELSGTAHAATHLRELERATHLIVRLGSDRWYRTHALLRTHLVDRLSRNDSARLLELRRSAAAALARRGMRREAIEMALDAEDWSEVVDEIRELREDMYQHGEWATLVEWLERLPADILEANPDLAMTRARHAMKFFDGYTGLARVESIDVTRLTPEQRVRREIYRSVALRHIGRVADALDACRVARTLARETMDDDDRVIAELNLEEGTSLNISGLFEPAAERFADAAKRFSILQDLHRNAEAQDGLGGSLGHVGQLPDAMQAFTSAQRIWRSLGDIRHQLSTMSNMGEVQRLIGDLETARDTFNIVVEESHKIGFVRGEAYGHLNIAVIEHQLGQLDVSASRYAIAMASAEHIDDSTLVAAATYGLGMVYRERGNFDRARALLEHGLRSADSSGMASYRVACKSGLGATLLSGGDARGALEHLEEARSEARAIGAPRELALAQLRIAAVLLKTRKRALAAAALTQIPEITATIGYDGFLIVDVRQQPEVMEFASARRVGGEYFAQLSERAQLASARNTVPIESEIASDVLRAEIFGAPRVFWRGRQISDLEWRSGRSKEMFFLLLHSGKALRKEQIAVQLWPDLTHSRLNSTFHSTLYRLRKAIDRDVVVQTDDGYRVNDSYAIDYDAREFERHMDAARRAEPATDQWCEQLSAAVDLYRGPFAEPFESDWAQEARRWYEDHYVSSLLALASASMGRNDYSEALSLIELIRAVDPLNEQAVLFEMSAHARGGHTELATRAFRRHSDAVREFGETPSDQLQREYERVLSGAALDS